MIKLKKKINIVEFFCSKTLKFPISIYYNVIKSIIS